MMRRMPLLFLRLAPAALAVLALSATASAQETALAIDPARTKVEFTLGDVLHTVHGGFALKRGDIRFDNTGKADGELVVDAASGQSGSEARDRRMRAHVLESERYPEIIFHPDRVEGKVALQGASQVRVHGMFEIHGQSHEIIMPFEIEASDGQYAATGTFQVPYVKWGMKNPSTLFLRVNETVSITIHTVAHPVATVSNSRSQ